MKTYALGSKGHATDITTIICWRRHSGIICSGWKQIISFACTPLYNPLCPPVGSRVSNLVFCALCFHSFFPSLLFMSCMRSNLLIWIAFESPEIRGRRITKGSSNQRSPTHGDYQHWVHQHMEIINTAITNKDYQHRDHKQGSSTLG